MSWQRLIVSSLALLWCASAAHSACTVAEADGRITLENDHLRLVLVPSQGGKCASVFFKDRQTELTSWPNYGCLEDRRWGPQGYERLRNYPYQVRILKRGPDEVAVALSSRCNDPGFTQLVVEKTLILRDRDAGVEVRYRWENGSKVTLPLGWWFFQDLALQGKKNAFYAPTPFGVEKTIHVPGEGQTSELFGRTADRFLYDAPRGWSAVIGETGVGAVATFDVKHTTFIYNFANPHETTLEWAFSQIDLEAGKSFETAFRVFPVDGLPTVDGAGEGLAGSLTTPRREGAWRKPAEFTAGEAIPVQAVVAGCKAETVQVRVEARAWPDGEWKEIGKSDLLLAPGKGAVAEFRFQPPWRATTVLRCVVSRGRQTVFDMERPVIYGEATGEYALKPTAEKVGKELATYRPKKAPEAPRQTAVTLPEDYQPTREVVTPHIPWARPWAGGKVRVLAPMHHIILRQLVEFAQRTDIDYETVAMDTNEGKMSVAELYLLRSKLDAGKYDVLFLADYDWNRLPDGVRAQILSQVEQGKGLVLVGTRAKLPSGKLLQDPFVEAGVLESLSPKQIRLMEHGKGRIAAAPYFAVFKGGLFEPSPVYHASYVKPIQDKYSRWFAYQEYAYALNARLMLWAAGRVPAVGMSLPAPTLQAGTPGQAVRVDLTSAIPGALELTLTDRWSATLARVSWPVTADTQSIPVVVPPLPAGPMVADVWLKRPDGAVVNWATRAFEVSGPVRFGAVTTDRDLYGDGETVRATVTLEGVSGPMTLQWRMFDCFDRLLAQGQQASSAQVEVSVPLRRPLARYSFLHLEAVREGATLAATRVGFPVKPLPEAHPFHFMAYGGYNERYREMFGCNTIFGAGERGMVATEQGWNLIAWQDIHRDFRVQAAGPEKVRAGCLSSPQFREECKKGIDAYAKYARLQGSLGILIADEWGYGGEGNHDSNYCHSPSCLAGFREFLKKEYGTLDALNRSWGTEHRDWAEIVPPTFEETQKSGKWERWTDHRRWVEALVADFFGFCAAHARQTYPEARFGFSGTPNAGSFNGYDWSLLCKTMHIICAYGGPQGETLRSFKQPGSFTSAWTGYDRQAQNEKNHRFYPWFALFNDMDGLGYYISVGYSPLHYPDWTWTKKAPWIAEQWRDLRGGIATLIRNGKRQHDGIAIHYSQSSIHSATRDGRYEQYNNILSSLCQLLEDQGLQYDFTSYGAIERGELKNYRLLILPYSQATSPKEAAQIAEFVRGGGTVLADFAPGLRDQHGKPAARGMLDEVFGVRSDPADLASFQLTPIVGEGVPADVQLPAGCVKLQLAGGTARARLPELGNAPAWIVHRVGRGQAVLLNFTFAGYAGYRPGGTGGEISIVEQAKQAVRLAVSAFARAVLSGVGMQPTIKITKSDGQPYLDAEIVRYSQGSATYVGVLPSATPGGLITKADTEPVALDFGREAHVYELRTRKHLGRIRTLSTELTRGVAQVYALMPQELDPIRLEITGAPSRNEGVRLTLSAKDVGADRVAHLSVNRPDGRSAWLYERDVILRGGRTDWTLPLALNEPKGVWKVQALDVPSGTAASVTFALP